MPKPRRLSGDDVVAVLSSFGFQVHSQRGSHVKLRRIREDGGKETLTIPRHKELDSGTLRAMPLHPGIKFAEAFLCRLIQQIQIVGLC